MIRYFQVAQLCFSLYVPDGFFAGDGLSNYLPFELDSPSGELLFSLRLERVTSEPQAEGSLVYDALEKAGIDDISDEMIQSQLTDVDIIIGGPPCQGFSAANRYEKETKDPRNALFFE